MKGRVALPGCAAVSHVVNLARKWAGAHGQPGFESSSKCSSFETETETPSRTRPFRMHSETIVKLSFLALSEKCLPLHSSWYLAVSTSLILLQFHSHLGGSLLLAVTL